MLLVLLVLCDCGNATEVRPSVLAGSWYPSDPEELRVLVTQYIETAGAAPDSSLLALISPHAGYAYSGPTAGEGFARLPEGKFSRVVILAPSHHVRLSGASIGLFDFYETPLGRIPVDRQACEKLLENPLFSTVRRAHLQEHSIEIELPFLQVVMKDFSIVPVLIGDISREQRAELAAVLAPLYDTHTLLIASSDFTHYGSRFNYVPFQASSVEDLRAKLQELDFEAADLISQRDLEGFDDFLERTKDTICGRNAIGVLLELLPHDAVGAKFSYHTSLDRAPDTRNSVSYLSIGFSSSHMKGSFPMEAPTSFLSENDQRALVRLARDVVFCRLEGRAAPDMDEFAAQMSDDVQKNVGVFVTLTINGHLRGCIGYIEGLKPMIRAVADNALSAAFRDPRFPPVSLSEWDDLCFKLSVLTPLEEVQDISEIEVGRHGLVLLAEGRRGVFLPEVPVEQGWDLETYLRELGRKAGLDRDAWKRAQLQKFESIVFGDELLSED